MTGTAPDKAQMRARWRARAPFWDGQADGLADMADRLNRPMIDAAGIAPGQDVLDLASGVGEPALTIARRVGAAGHVTATDLVDEMLAGCRRRAAAAGLTNIDCRQADMEDLPFADGRFDRVTCRFGVMFVPQADRALAEAYRVLKPGGRAAFMVWGHREDTVMFTIIAAAARAVFGDDPSFDFDTPFRFGAPGQLAALFTAAGFADAGEIDTHFSPRMPADQPFWTPQVKMGLGPRLNTATAAEAAALDDAIRDGLAPYRNGDGYDLRVHIKFVSGEKPMI